MVRTIGNYPDLSPTRRPGRRRSQGRALMSGLRDRARIDTVATHGRSERGGEPRRSRVPAVPALDEALYEARASGGRTHRGWCGRAGSPITSTSTCSRYGWRSLLVLPRGRGHHGVRVAVDLHRRARTPNGRVRRNGRRAIGLAVIGLACAASLSWLVSGTRGVGRHAVHRRRGRCRAGVARVRRGLGRGRSWTAAASDGAHLGPDPRGSDSDRHRSRCRRPRPDRSRRAASSLLAVVVVTSSARACCRAAVAAAVAGAR